MATLNSANVDEDFTMTAGGGRFSATADPGAWDGVKLQLFWADAATDTVFNPLPGGELLGPQALVIDLRAGDILRAVISKPGGVGAATSINATYLE